MSLFADVDAFHRKFGLPTIGDDLPSFLPEDVFSYRMGFMLEELSEFCIAHSQKDMAKAADALADLVYVALGTGLFMNIPFDPVWSEVQRANLQKERATGADDPRSKRGHSLDVVKPRGWTPPSHDVILIRAAMDTLGLDPRGWVLFRDKTYGEFLEVPSIRRAIEERSVDEAA